MPKTAGPVWTLSPTVPPTVVPRKPIAHALEKLEQLDVTPPTVTESRDCLLRP